MQPNLQSVQLTSNCSLQISGRCRMLLIGPEFSFPGMYPFPVHHGYDRYSMVSLDDVDLGAYPAFSRVRGQKAVLRAGEVLHVPAYW